MLFCFLNIISVYSFLVGSDAGDGEPPPSIMRRRLRTKLLLSLAAVLLFAIFSLRIPRHSLFIAKDESRFLTFLPEKPPNQHSYAVAKEETSDQHSRHTRRVSSFVVNDESSVTTVSVLLADWEVLVISDDDRFLGDDRLCRFQNNATSPARFSGRLPSTNRTAFKCLMPNSVRRLRPFLMPILTEVDGDSSATIRTQVLYRWNFLVYDSLAAENDVILFVKGVNHRQGMSRSPSEFSCVFRGGGVVVETAVTSSSQEVFRCVTPDLTAFGSSATKISVSLQIKSENNLVVPSVARYVPPRRKLANPEAKRQLCASAMVYNAAKFLREWVTYHSRIGVDKFILYDNDSNDNLTRVVSDLRNEGYDIATTFWVWPKTQEAGFSHVAIHGKNSCVWIMYVDVDEFVFSPSWANKSEPSINMLKSLLPRTPQSDSSSSSNRPIGQVSLWCNEFGPSNQRSHPVGGVMQGYTCRRRVAQRHKSIVLLEAVDSSLLSVIHHFRLKDKYVTKTLDMESGIVNHYKYQAWPEFRNKFRRRVSTYVVDWTQKSNLGSKDRTPGLGFEPIEPRGWDNKFCEVRDERLKIMTRTWFESPTSNGFNLAWQR